MTLMTGTEAHEGPPLTEEGRQTLPTPISSTPSVVLSILFRSGDCPWRTLSDAAVDGRGLYVVAVRRRRARGITAACILRRCQNPAKQTASPNISAR